LQSENPLIGTWELISFELRQEDGTIKYPWGSDIKGQIMYGSDGYMAGSFMKGDRPTFEGDDVMAGSSIEFEEAMKSYIGYAGPYNLQGRYVFHQATISFFPNWTDTTIKRAFDVEGNRLTLTTPPLIYGGISVIAALVWKKLPSLKI
jgi:hypothetical protein